MDATISIDLSQIRNELKLSQENIERTVELLDEGNTVPFITRYRKDQTGGLDEEQVRAIYGDDRRREANEAAYQAMRRRYEIVIDWPAETIKGSDE